MVDAKILIIGGGGAGMSAALTAAEKGGTDILVLEKAGSPGGSTAMSHDIFAAESPVQKRAGVDARRDELFKMAMEWAHWSGPDPRIVRAFIDKSGDTVRWLENKGISFELLSMFPNQVPLVRHAVKGKGTELMRVLRKNCEDLGVKVLTRTRARKIIRGENGEIIGVLAENKNGDIRINAKRVIITTGGYGNNKEMLKKYYPFYHDTMTYDGVRNNTGDGILMAIEIGADTAGLGFINTHGPAAIEKPGVAPMNIDTVGTDGKPLKMTLKCLAREPETIWVNKYGRRFIDEGYILQFFAFGNAIARQPEGTCYTLFDSRIMQMMEEQGLIMQLAPHWLTLEAFTPLPGLSRELLKQVNDVFKISDSWDEIAAWIGAEPCVLKATIEEYNIACDQGYDNLFCKDRRYLLPVRKAPFYAIKAHVRICDTMGGIKVNERMEVIDTQGKIIPGLYAAGVSVGGWESENYNYRLTGHLVSFALNSGRIAGENVVKYLSK
jgi:fumarate reductase flavoprotein subunit